MDERDIAINKALAHLAHAQRVVARALHRIEQQLGEEDVKPDEQQLEALYGPVAQFSDHKPGDTITYRSGGREITDVIMWVIAPGQSHGIMYVMTEPDPSTSLPALCFPSEIIATPEPPLYQCSCGAMHNAGQRCPLA